MKIDSERREHGVQKNLSFFSFKIISKIINPKAEILYDSKRVRPHKSEVERLCANNKKAIEILKWKPLFYGEKGLEEGLQITVEWFKLNKNLSKYKSDIFNI